MTKLQRYEKAKRQTIKKWEGVLSALLTGTEWVFVPCGFCGLYGDTFRCGNCPISKACDGPCSAQDWYIRENAMLGQWVPKDFAVFYCLAILCWLHSDDLKPLALESASK